MLRSAGTETVFVPSRGCVHSLAVIERAADYMWQLNAFNAVLNRSNLSSTDYLHKRLK